MREAIEEVLRLQTEYSSKITEAMKRRGDIVKVELPNELRMLLPDLEKRVGVGDLDVQGKDGSGSLTEVPWTRLYSRSRSPKPTGGWYLVFLFSADGTRAYLSLNQGTTRWDGGGWHPQPPSEISARADWARKILTASEPFPSRWTTDIRLNNRVSELGTLYERGNVVAVEYPVDHVPPDEQIKDDLLTASSWLGEIYRQSGDGLDELPMATMAPRVWIFQANPPIYDYLQDLQRPSTQSGWIDTWSVRQHAKEIAEGDIVLLWSAGDAAGIYATGTVVGPVFQRDRQAWEGPNAPASSLDFACGDAEK